MFFVRGALFESCIAAEIHWSIAALLGNEPPKETYSKQWDPEKNLFFPEQNEKKDKFLPVT